MIRIETGNGISSNGNIYRRKLTEYRDTHSGERPTKILDSTSGQKSKYRKSYTTLVCAMIRMGVCPRNHATRSPENKALDLYVSNYTDEEFWSRKELVDPLDVEITDQMVSVALGEVDLAKFRDIINPLYKQVKKGKISRFNALLIIKSLIDRDTKTNGHNGTHFETNEFSKLNQVTLGRPGEEIILFKADTESVQ